MPRSKKKHTEKKNNKKLNEPLSTFLNIFNYFVFTFFKCIFR